MAVGGTPPFLLILFMGLALHFFDYNQRTLFVANVVLIALGLCAIAAVVASVASLVTRRGALAAGLLAGIVAGGAAGFWCLMALAPRHEM